jgi:alkanesulfonate monooxygenase
MRLNAFAMNCVGHQAQGLWRHPRDRSAEYTSLRHWTDLARTLERGRFDTLFLADVLGVYDVYQGSPDAALRNATQVPVNDPMLLVPAMAAVTEHLGFGVTGILTFEPPYVFARRMSTLDHLTDGRISWNVVTGYLDSAARAAGMARQVAHDTRYDIADEYMDVVYELWEGSWEDGAVIRDRAAGVFTDPAKVHPVSHHGDHYDVDGIHLSEPSPQRTPVLFQAGSSERGQVFAARHAECVFLADPSPRRQAETVDRLRDHVVAAGRRPSDVLVFSMVSVIVGDTDADAERRRDEYRRYISKEGALALMSGWSGVDLSDPKGGGSPAEAIRAAGDATVAESRAAAERVALSGASPVVVGSPARVVDELEAWMADTGVDGFNLTYLVMPETFVDFVDMVVPELERRRLLEDYRPGTLREKLFGRGPRLRPPHPAAAFRR